VLPYYRLLKEVYDIIIINWSTSVANVFRSFLGEESMGGSPSSRRSPQTRLLRSGTSSDKLVSKQQFLDFLEDQIMPDLGLLRRSGGSFDKFFEKFFDNGKTGTTTLSRILATFHDKIDLKVPLKWVILDCIDIFIEFENFIHTFFMRALKKVDERYSNMTLQHVKGKEY
jgi:hypothetical protein